MVRRFPRIGFSSTALDLRLALLLLLIAMAIGTLGLMLIEGYTLVDAFYMSVITLSTVGFGEVKPLSGAGRMFVSALVVFNIGIVAYVLAAFSYYVIDGKLFETMQYNRIQSKIGKMQGHTIVCGYGKYGQEIVSHLRLHDHPYVVIEQNEEKLRDLIEEERDALYVVDDATHDETLFAAGIERANALITALNDDSDNLFIVLSSKDLNPGLRIVSRAKEVRSRQKMMKAGASHVIMPEQIGGFYMATLISKPGAVEFFSFITNELSADIGFEELRYDQMPGKYRNKPIMELNLRSSTGVNIIGHRLQGGKYRVNPGPKTILEPEGSFIVVGNPEQLTAFRKLFNLPT
ncbi:Glutathione-regulated potassium-efflux system protein KefC [Neolewinella maritima]|uniref:Glutathione-regulated potassium-efflux system protein KefC n=1 Tax=Neolewinella maritima TaxID=1383882 RepID=A0ABN8F2L8_9BACT|nr:potassium channel protein [Neolewinella maritima]CAH1001223.1 Glutathione-regulated potassium-efflux system protein KefC [Neolewinella maritima]